MGRRIQRTSSQDLKKLLLCPTGGRFMRPIDAYDQVYPGIVLGDASTALSTCLLKEIKVTHVLNAAHGRNDDYYGGFVNTSFSNYDRAGIKFMGVPALDTPSFYLRSYFRQAADFIETAIRSGGKVLVHCQCGISRSATLIAAYLMIKKGMDVQEALSTIRAHRSIFPNQGFLSQLADFEYELKRAGSLPDIHREVSPDLESTKLVDASSNPAFHADHRPMFTSTNYWPLVRPVSRSGYPVSSAYWDYETESRARARSLDRLPSSIYSRARSASPPGYRTIRSTSVIPDALYYQDRPSRSVSVCPTTRITETRSSSPVLSSYDVTTRPYQRSFYYNRTSPEPFYYTPRIYTKSSYDPYYSSNRYYSSYDYSPYVSPYHSRYYSKYYSPSSYDYTYRSPYYPYTSYYNSSYVPLSVKYPYLYGRNYY